MNSNGYQLNPLPPDVNCDHIPIYSYCKAQRHISQGSNNPARQIGNVNPITINALHYAVLHFIDSNVIGHWRQCECARIPSDHRLGTESPLSLSLSLCVWWTFLLSNSNGPQSRANWAPSTYWLTTYNVVYSLCSVRVNASVDVSCWLCFARNVLYIPWRCVIDTCPVQDRSLPFISIYFHLFLCRNVILCVVVMMYSLCGDCEWLNMCMICICTDLCVVRRLVGMYKT